MTFLIADTFLGSAGEKKRWHTKNGSEWERREDCEKRSEIMEEAYYYREEERKRDYSFLFSFNMNIVYTRKKKEWRRHEFQETTFRMFTFRFSLWTKIYEVNKEGDYLFFTIIILLFRIKTNFNYYLLYMELFLCWHKTAVSR